MSTISINKDRQDLFDLLNQQMEAMLPKLSKILTVDRLVNEAHTIRVTESSIPESLRMQMHFDMILGEGDISVKDYTEGLTGRNNRILEAARKAFPNSKEITESIESFREYLLSQLNEGAAEIALGSPSSTMSASGFDTALSGGEMEARAGGGFWGILKKLWNALTEGGSAWGIFHLILDVIGLVGDFIIPGVGVAADIINAIVYAIRGEYFLATISIIAAVVVGAGDTLKLFKPIAKEAGGVMAKLSVKPGMDVGQALVNVGAKERPLVMRCLGKIASYAGGAVAKAINVMGGFFQGFGKITGKIPGLGWLIKPIFDSMGRVLTSFANKISNFTQNYALLSKNVAKESLENLDILAKNAKTEGTVFKFSEDGTVLYAFNKEGNRIAKLPSDFVEKSKFFDIRYGEGAAQRLFDPARGPLAKQVNQYYKTVAKIADNTTILNRFKAFFTKNIPKGAATFAKALPFFIGKQIYKLIFGKHWTGEDGQWSKKEITGHGNAALNSWINDRISKERKESGAVYLPAITLDSSEEEVNQHITDYQNHYAKQLNQPGIVEAIKKQGVAEDTKKEFDDFWAMVEDGEVKRGGKGDKIDHTLADELSSSMGGQTSTNYSKPERSRPKFESKTISSFSEFNKRV
jgi:hypothetical protein